MSRKKKKRVNKFKNIISKAHCDEKNGVERRTEVARRYEEFHDNFINYDKLVEFLEKVQRRYSNRVNLTQIGESSQGRKIYMVIIASPKSSAEEPKSGVMIEAGLNGRDWMAVSNALVIIDCLVKNDNSARLMDYYIIPCSNPDAYDSSFRPSPRYCQRQRRAENGVHMDLTHNFPFMLGMSNMQGITTNEFLVKIGRWKENYAFGNVECNNLLHTIYNYQLQIKLFISIQQGGRDIIYPFGFGPGQPEDIDELQKVARSGRAAMKTRCLDYGTIYEVRGLEYGNILDFLRMQQNMMKYVYIIQVTKTCTAKDTKNILRYGGDTLRCINVMSAAVYKDFNKCKPVECVEKTVEPKNPCQNPKK